MPFTYKDTYNYNNLKSKISHSQKIQPLQPVKLILPLLKSFFINDKTDENNLVFYNEIENVFNFKKKLDSFYSDIYSKIITSIDENIFEIKQITDLEVNIISNESAIVDLDFNNKFVFLREINIDYNDINNKIEKLIFDLFDNSKINLEKIIKSDIIKKLDLTRKTNPLSQILSTVLLSDDNLIKDDGDFIKIDNVSKTQINTLYETIINKQDISQISIELQTFLKNNFYQKSFFKININTKKDAILKLHSKNIIDIFDKSFRKFNFIRVLESKLNQKNFIKFDLDLKEQIDNKNESDKKIVKEDEQIFENLKYIAITVILFLLIVFFLFNKKFF